MKNRKWAILAGCLLSSLGLQVGAAEITWDAPVSITDSGSDVIREGGRWAAELMAGSATTIQGVTFRGKGGFTNIMYSSGSVYSGDSICPSPSVPNVDDDYRTMLRGVSWQPSAGTYEIIITNLTPNTEYKVQIWSSSADGLAAGATVKWMDAESGGNEVILSVQGADGALGQFVVGTFTADITGIQHIYGTGSDAFLNGLQIRDMSRPDGSDDTDVIPDAPVPGPAAVEWEEAHNISNDFDIATEGTLVAAENIGNDNEPTVNGVTFSAWNSTGYFSYSSSLNYTGVGAPGVSDEYKTLLDGVSWDETGQFSVTITGLKVGQRYLIQTWTSSQLNAASDENVFVIDSESGETNGVVINSNVGGGLGQYCIGRFTATSTTQIIGVEKKSVGGNGNPSLSAFQIRSLDWMPATPFQGWMASYGLTNATLTDDNDNDGAENLYEYAFNGDPTNAANTGVAPIITNTTAGVSYVYLKRTDDSNLTYTLEFTDNLVTDHWTNNYTVTEGVIDSVWTAVTNTPPASDKNVFFDFEVSHP